MSGEAIIKTIKTALKYAQQSDNIPLQNEIINLQMTTNDLIQELRDKDKKIEELSKRIDLRKNLIHKFKSYWLKKDDGDLDGPFCIGCADSEGKTIRLIDNLNKHYRCPVCKIYFSLSKNSEDDTNIKVEDGDDYMGGIQYRGY